MTVKASTTLFDETVACLCQRVERFLTLQASKPDQRILIALAGVPGSGKSHVSAALLDAVGRRGIEDVVVIPMDGFHYSKAALYAFVDPTLAFRRRGAPFTFDVTAFLELVLALKTIPVTAGGEPEFIMRAPSFDHANQDPVVNDISISSRSKIVIIEGNYTLLNETPWNTIAEIVDDRWFVDVPSETAKERLIDRHMRAGIETSRESAARRAEDNDILNGDLIRSKLIRPDIKITN